MTRLSVQIPGDDYFRSLIPCQSACPVHTDARGYVRAIADGRFEDAYLIARGPNPLAAICGRVCGAPCEVACRRGAIDEAISIRALKRFAHEQFEAAADTAALHLMNRLRDHFATRTNALHEELGQPWFQANASRHSPKPQTASKRGRSRVAVIGSGPAGLACAHDLALLGHEVVVLEMEPVKGGMLALGIPAYRLPRALIAREIEVIESLGVEIRCGVEVGKTVSLATLRADYDAVVIAVGAKRSRDLPLPGVRGPGVMGGVEFLRDVSLGKPVVVGPRVVVVGGGNVAYDVARTAIRHDGADVVLPPPTAHTQSDVARTAARVPKVDLVHLVCLEARTEMPADEIEVREGEEEGVVRHNRLGPTQIVRDDEGEVAAVSFQQCSRVFDENGRFAPLFDPSDTVDIPCDSVLLAIGQSTDLSFIEPDDNVPVQPNGWPVLQKNRTASPAAGVFWCGDVATGPKLMIDAVASGKQAAGEVHAALTGAHPTAQITEVHTVLEPYVREAAYEAIGRATPEARPPEARVGDMEYAVEDPFAPAVACREASRCLDCGVNTIFDAERCVLCGGCVEVCPEHVLMIVPATEIAGEGLDALADATGCDLSDASAIVKDESRCIRCANCAQRCPTGAVRMERFACSEVLV